MPISLQQLQSVHIIIYNNSCLSINRTPLSQVCYAN